MTTTELIEQLKQKNDIGRDGVASFMKSLMSGALVDEEIMSFLIALSEKGESVEELIGAAQVMRASSNQIHPKAADILDTCGTGGDGASTLNVSTLVSLICASLGITVAKHGNRAISGKSGSADLLEKMGVPINLKPKEAEQWIDDYGFAFLFAPNFHPAMKHAASARKKIGRRTIFNCLGPLSNPAGANRYIVGVYEQRLVPIVANTLAELGAKHVICVCSDDGLDEVSISTSTLVCEYKNQSMETYRVKPEDFGLRPQPMEVLKCASPEESLKISMCILGGAMGPQTEFVVLNAAFALKASGLVEKVSEGVDLARHCLADGLVKKYLKSIVGIANE